MAVLRMNLEQWTRYHARLADQLHPTVMRGVASAAQRALRMIQQRVREAPPATPGGALVVAPGAVNTGGYLRRWKVVSIPNGKRVLNNHPAAATIEDGRRAGSKFPPLRAVRDWLIRKLGMPPEEARAAAFPVARAIARRGLLARKILTAEDALEQVQRFLEEDVVHEIEAELAKRT